MILIQFEITRPVAAIKSLRFALLYLEFSRMLLNVTFLRQISSARNSRCILYMHKSFEIVFQQSVLIVFVNDSGDSAVAFARLVLMIMYSHYSLPGCYAP